MMKIVKDRKRLIDEMIESRKNCFPYPIQIETDGFSTLPFYSKKGNILTCTELCETTLLLLNLCQVGTKQLKKVLFLYLLTEINISRLNLSNAGGLLVKLEKEVGNLRPFNSSSNIDLELQLMFLVGHELQHACYAFDKQLKQVDIENVHQSIMELYANPETIRQEQVFKLIPEICSEKRRMEELACDIGSVKFISKYIVKHYSTNEIPQICSQLLRIVTMLQYAINIYELAEFRINNIRLYSKKHIFDIIRVGNVAMTLANILETDAISNLGENLQNEVFAYNKVLSNSIKIGLEDLWILHTAQASSVEEDRKKYESICTKFTEISKHIKYILIN